MKKSLALFLFTAVLVGCSTQAPPEQPASSDASSLSATSSVASSVASEAPQTSSSEPSASSEASSEASSSSAPKNETEKKVTALLSVSYGENWASFYHKLDVDQTATYENDSQTVTIERQLDNGNWERIGEGGADTYAAQDKLAVKGPLPTQVLSDVLTGRPYRITTRIDSDKGTVMAQSIFLAGNTFGQGQNPPATADAQTLEVQTTLHAQNTHETAFVQTITNRSSQTLALDAQFDVLRQNENGLWQVVETERTAHGASPLLLPGVSYTTQGTLPLSSEQLSKTKHRMRRTASVVLPLITQPAKLQFEAELSGTTASSQPGDSTQTQQSEMDFSKVSLVLAQTSFAPGDVPVAAYVRNASAYPVTSGKVRVYHVKSGEEVSPGEAPFTAKTIPAGETGTILEQMIALEAGDYILETTLREGISGEPCLLTSNFSVREQGIEKPASASTVKMQVSIHSETDGVLPFAQQFTNESTQTLLISRVFRVEELSGGLWTAVAYPKGMEQPKEQDLLLLYPGESTMLEGYLPFGSKNAPRTYRIARSIGVVSPQPNQQNGLTLVYTVNRKDGLNGSSTAH